MGNETSQPGDINIAGRVTVFTVMQGLVLSIGVVFLLFFVPKIAAVLTDMSDGNARLSNLTILVFNISQFALNLSYLCIVFVLGVLTAVVSIYYLLLRSSGKWAANTWSVVVLLCEGSLMMVCVLAMLLQVMQFTEALK